MITLEYSHNNSGGDWWLSDDDWHKLEAAGWKVEWYSNENALLRVEFYPGGRFLGALATRASKSFETKEQGIQEWEKILGQNADEHGCPCCGKPHCFLV